MSTSQTQADRLAHSLSDEVLPALLKEATRRQDWKLVEKAHGFLLKRNDGEKPSLADMHQTYFDMVVSAFEELTEKIAECLMDPASTRPPLRDSDTNIALDWMMLEMVRESFISELPVFIEDETVMYALADAGYDFKDFWIGCQSNLDPFPAKRAREAAARIVGNACGFQLGLALYQSNRDVPHFAYESMFDVSREHLENGF
jgi:hypothetical protein